MEPGASIIIVTYNSATTIAECLLSVADTLRPQDEVILVDNRSQDNTLEIVDRLNANLIQKVCILPQSQNFGFSRGCNIGIENSNKEYVILLNPDTDVMGEWIQRLTDHFIYYKNTGAVGPLSNNCVSTQNILTYIRNYKEFDLNAEQLLKILYETFNKRSIPTKLLIGFCMTLRRDLIDEWGGLDENIFLGNDDLEMSWRLREQGYFLRVALDVFVNHRGHVSFETLSRSCRDELISQSSDVLFEKMQNCYFSSKVPHPRIYFGIDWWRPSILKTKSPEEVFSTNLLEYPYEKIIPKVQQLLRDKQAVEAIQLLKDSLSFLVRDHNLWLMLGSICLAIHDYDEAEIALKNAWALQFREGRAKQKLLNLLKQQGKHEEIRVLFGDSED